MRPVEPIEIRGVVRQDEAARAGLDVHRPAQRFFRRLQRAVAADHQPARIVRVAQRAIRQRHGGNRHDQVDRKRQAKEWKGTQPPRFCGLSQNDGVQICEVR